MDEKTIRRALDLGNQIEADRLSGGPLTRLVAYARKGAIEAIRALLDADPTDAKEIYRLKNEVERFRELVDWVRDAQTAAEEHWQTLSEQEREEVIGLLEPHHEPMDDT